MGSPAPLDRAEDELCRAFATVLHTLPRELEGELRRKARVTTREYVALAQLADHRDEGLRINQLAVLVGLSASRVSRLVDTLATRGEVRRKQGEDDGRTQRLEVTPAGMARLEAALPHHLASVRRHVLDYVDTASFTLLTEAFKAIVGDSRQIASSGDGAGPPVRQGADRPTRVPDAPGRSRAPSGRPRPGAGELKPQFRQQA